jgi:acetyltransferase-like isoleucine patch superfamily enzyme
VNGIAASTRSWSGCAILDTAPVRIGEATMLGPQVQIYGAEHHKQARKRQSGLEIARPAEIGANLWVGGGAIWAAFASAMTRSSAPAPW